MHALYRYQPELLVYSTRGVDIWAEEKKRKPPPLLPPKPNIANYLSVMSESIESKNKSTIHGVSPHNPRLPAHLTSIPPTNGDLPPISSVIQVPSYSSHITHMAGIPPPQEGLLPSAPPAPPDPTNYRLQTRRIHYPPNHRFSESSTEPKSPKPPPQVPIPSKDNPVVLVKIEKIPIAIPHLPTDRNSNTNNGNINREQQESSLLIDFESIPRPSISSDPFLLVSSPSAPNLLLDIENNNTDRESHKPSRNPKKVKTAKEDENLINFVEIKPINTDDVYLQLFPSPETRTAVPSSPYTPVVNSSNVHTQRNVNKNHIL